MDQHPPVARVVDVDAAVAIAPVVERDLPPVPERHQGPVARLARDAADGVEAQA